jgi:pentatricopeptide repeat protein
MLVRCGIKEEAMKRYKEIQQDASAQSDLFYLVLLATCSDARDFELGRRAYVDMQKQDLDSNLFLVNAILKFLTQSGDIKGARQVYSMMKNSSIMKITNVTHLIVLGACQEAYQREQDAQVYDFGLEVAKDALEDSGSANDERVLTQIVTMYFKFGLVDKARELYYERRETFKATSFSILLVECASTEHQDFGRDIFHDAAQLGYQGLNLKNAMITMLFKIKKPQYAIDFFEQMIKQRIQPDENTILAMLEGCVASEQVQYGYKVIDRTKSRVRWTLQLIIAVVRVYLENNDIHSIAMLELEEFRQFKNKQFYGTILTMLVDYGATEISDSLAADMKSSRFFDSVELGNVFMNVVASTSIKNAFELFQRKQKQDIHTYETILLHCARTTSYDIGMTIYEMMRFESKPINTTIMSLVIDLAIKSGQFEEALLLEEKMIFMEPEPDENIYLTMMASCGDIGNQQLALQIQKLVVKRKEVSVNTFNGLIAMNGRCGLVDEAISLFNVLKKNADSTTWSIIIHICSINNLADDALRHMEEMQQHGHSVTRDIIIGVLNACCKASKVVETLDIVKTMEEKYNIVPNLQNHNLVVETLCRAGHLQLAEQYINAMPERDHCTHTLYIEGLLKEGKVEKARKKLNALKLRRSKTSQCDILWNMYAKEMVWDTVNQKLVLNQNRSRKILPECAYVYIEKSEKLDNARCYAFTIHEEIEAKQKVVALLTDLLNAVHSEHGFVSFQMKDENAWRHELELLALGTALHFTPQGTNVTITTDRKIGWSRLEFIRLVSLVTKRNIRVRDASGWIEFSS